MSLFKHAFWMMPFLLVPTVALSQGSAADLDGLPSVGWPLGVPMTCQALSEAIAGSLNDSIEKLQRHCNDQNEQMRNAGFASCAKDLCLDKAIQTAHGRNLGALRLRLGRSEWTGQFYVTLNYTLSDLSVSNSQRPTLSCFNPRDRAEELLREEFETWDFKRFVEFCVKKK